MKYQSNLSLFLFSAVLLIIMGRCASTGNISKNPNSLEETNKLISTLSDRIAELEEHKKTINLNTVATTKQPEEAQILLDQSSLGSGPVVISGKVEGKLKHLRLKRSLPYQADFSKKIIVSETGEFSMELNLDGPNFYKLHVGDQSFDVFLKPGAQCHIAVDVENSTLVFTGDLAATNNFCSQTDDKENDKYDFAIVDYKQSEESFISQLNTTRTADEALLLASTLPLDADFVSLEKARNNCGYNRAILKYNLANGLTTADCKFDQPLIDAPELFGLYEYRKWAFEYFEAVSQPIDFKAVKSKQARQEYFTNKYSQVDQIFSSKTLVDFIKTDVVYTCIARVCSPIMNNMVTSFYDDIDHRAFENKIGKRYASIMKGRNGALAPQLTGHDKTGKNISLNAYKGKYVYLFTWASWCGPCKMEVEPFHHLLQEFGGKNIEFVGVSIDKDKQKWLDSFKKRDAFPGNQIRIGGNWNSPFVEAFDIASVPQGVLIGPDGIVIDANAPKPSKLRSTLLTYDI